MRHHPEVTDIEYNRSTGYWIVSLGEAGQIGLCTCELLNYDAIREQVLRRLGSVLEPMTNDEWISLSADIVCDRYEQGLLVTQDDNRDA